MTAETSAGHPELEARLDKLTQALFHVTAEYWVMRDRQAVLERVLADAGIDAPDLVETYRPSEELAAALTAERDAFIAGLVALLAPEV